MKSIIAVALLALSTAAHANDVLIPVYERAGRGSEQVVGWRVDTLMKCEKGKLIAIEDGIYCAVPATSPDGMSMTEAVRQGLYRIDENGAPQRMDWSGSDLPVTGCHPDDGSLTCPPPPVGRPVPNWRNYNPGR